MNLKSFLYWVTIGVTVMVISYIIISIIEGAKYPVATKYFGPVGFQPEKIVA